MPQGTVLASIFFIIMISDIDENLRNSIIRLFTNDTKVNAKIRTEEDIEMLRQDLDNVYRRADENLMEFSERNFEKMSHGESGDIKD